ncbi:hypothetical protein [Vampirovibrio chlorellavorus]|uniref:hypothetical protein n=1 Tax=Vampirovibrio chlorellavorus TaxID=758823 RepID=UPI0026F1D9AB|nr:hypothetical protein [Vampirovibrio chlorellavorus]
MVNLEWLKSCTQTNFYQLLLAIVIAGIAYLGVYGLPHIKLNDSLSAPSPLDDNAAHPLNVSGVMA